MADQSHASEFTRRDFVVGASALSAVWIAAACARGGDTPAAAPTTTAMKGMSDAPAPPQQLKHFSADQAKEIDAITSRILPSDDSPGAHEAGVLFFIDGSLTTFSKEQAPLFDAGLVAVAKATAKTHGATAKFSALTAAQQDAILTGIEKTPFFGAIRFATIAGFLSLPKYGGNKDFIGWKFIGQEHVFEHHPPFGWYDQPENQKALLGRVL